MSGDEWKLFEPDQPKCYLWRNQIHILAKPQLTYIHQTTDYSDTKSIKTFDRNRIWNKSGRKHKTYMFWMRQKIRADGQHYELKYGVTLVSNVSNFRLCFCSESIEWHPNSKFYYWKWFEHFRKLIGNRWSFFLIWNPLIVFHQQISTSNCNKNNLLLFANEINSLLLIIAKDIEHRTLDMDAKVVQDWEQKNDSEMPSKYENEF